MNAKKLLSTLLSAAMAVSMLAGCFGGGGNKNYSDEAADAANAVQSYRRFRDGCKAFQVPAGRPGELHPAG